MKTSVFKTQNCSVARALEVVGDWWTLLIIREAIYGIQRFGEFEKGLGIAKNVLSERLAKLVETGVLERVSVPGRGNPQNYILTEMGRELLPVVIALMQWGDRWIHGPARDKKTVRLGYRRRASPRVDGLVHPTERRSRARCGHVKVQGPERG